VTVFGYSLSTWSEIVLVVIFALSFFVFALRGLSKTD